MRFSVALICMMVVASGCGPSEREVATKKLMSAWDSGVVADHSMQDYIRELISVGADVNARNTLGNTPLMYAAGNSSTPEIVQLLLEKGAELNARSTGGITPLMIDKWNSNPEIKQLLIDAGATE